MQCPNHSPLPKQDWFDWEQWEPHEAKANVKLAISNRKFNIRLTGYAGDRKSSGTLSGTTLLIPFSAHRLPTTLYSTPVLP